MPPVGTEEVVEVKEAGKGQPETVTISKADYERVQRERDEAKQSERYWAERSRSGKHEAEPEDEDPGIDTSDLVPEITGAEGVDESIFADPEKWVAAVAKGPKAIQDLIRKEGYVNAKQVAEIAAKVARRTVDVERGKITTDNKLMTQFPELQDNTSELFKATAEEYQELLKFDPSAKKNPLTLFAAARAAKARLAKAPKAKAEDDDEYERVDHEGDRLQRVRAQDGSRGGKGRGGDEDDPIGPAARHVMEQMGVSEDKFRASAKRIGVVGRRR